MTTPFGTTPNARLTVQDIATRVKRAFGDEAGAQITDNDILRWITDAQRELAASSSLLQTKATATVVSGTADYTLPTDMLTLVSVKLDGNRLKALDPNEAEAYNAAIGVPVGFSMWASSITLLPTPQGTGSLSLLYTRNPVACTTLNDIPELPAQYHNRIVDYCMAMAMELDDNMQAAQIKMASFKEGANAMREDASWTDREVYPSITMIDDGYC